MTSSSPAIRGELRTSRRSVARVISNLVVLELLVVALGNSQTAPIAPDVCPPPPPYKYLRAEEDYRYLAKLECRSDPLDVIKYIRLRIKTDWFASLGGEARENVEYFSNPRWGQQPQGSPYALQRYMLHADVHLGERWRLFTQLKSGLENNREGGARPIDEDKLDFNQGFLDLTLFAANNRHLTLRAGRQELAFGSRRYISAREGPNVRQSFDGIRLILSSARWSVSLLATKPVQTKLRFFDDAPDHKQTLWGVYATAPMRLVSGANVDLYYLGLDRKQARFEQGAGREQRHSLGGRLWGHRGAWDEDLEATYQWGTFSGGDIRAWAVASEAGYSIPSFRLKPRIAVETNVQTGDRNPLDRSLQTFNPLFPRGLYHQLVDLNGHVNSVELNPTIVLHPSARLTLTTDCDFFWRESAGDGLYNVGGFFFRSGKGSKARYIGSQPSLIGDWRIQRHIAAVFIYTHFNPGPFLKQTGPARTVNYGSIWLGYKF
jgi:hypothetical protein